MRTPCTHTRFHSSLHIDAQGTLDYETSNVRGQCARVSVAHSMGTVRLTL